MDACQNCYSNPLPKYHPPPPPSPFQEPAFPERAAGILLFSVGTLSKGILVTVAHSDGKSDVLVNLWIVHFCSFHIYLLHLPAEMLKCCFCGSKGATRHDFGLRAAQCGIQAARQMA